jgi:hypothetical protein
MKKERAKIQPMVKEALKDIVGKRLLNHQLIVMTDQFNNYKAKVNAIFEN